ncbi:MAG: hypothetical protein NC200_07725 [Candidatus Gastranaerophilales bacterium]|nr:hypothetical protein [Candidatus Gastranaerophilales bacterium]
MRTSFRKSPISQIKTAIRNYKYEKHEKELNKLVNLEDVQQPDAYRQLFEARELLARHAKANKVSLQFITPPSSSEKDAKNLAIFVNGDYNYVSARINSDTNAIETVQRPIYRMLEDKDGLNYQSVCMESHEDNFLKRVYRKTDELISRLNNKK